MSSIWRGWQIDPGVLAGLLLAGGVYVAGLRVLWRRRLGRGLSVRRAWSFGAGLLVLAGALLGPLPSRAEGSLSAHMLQHVLLVMVAAPLLVLGRPGLAIGAAVPPRWRARVHSLRSGPAVALRWLGRPLVAWLLAAGILLAWHVPALYEDAVRSGWLHATEHATILGAALLFWWVPLAPGIRRLAGGADVLYVFTAGFPGAALGALLAFAPAPLYPMYATRSGIDALADQQLAGLIMWVPSGVVFLAAASVLFVRWLGESEAAARRQERRTGAPPRAVVSSARGR
jgi:putative membrane protein